MTLLAGTLYDPLGGAVSKATSSLLAMTAVDTTNLRLTFNAPANGTVLVRLSCQVTGATTYPSILLGVIENSPAAGTLRGRQTPAGAFPAALATDVLGQEACYTVSGLTPGQTYIWDAAYGVETLVAATNIKYGGPDTNAGANAWGGFAFEVWDTIGLLASKMYDPTGGAFVAKSGLTLIAMTALDTSNLRCTFVVPPSGKVWWHVRVPFRRAGANWGSIMLGVLDGATVKGRCSPARGMEIVNAASLAVSADASGVVSGLTPGASLSYDAAYAVQVVASASTGSVVYGGPDNNTTTTDAYGGAAFEVWAA